MIITLDGIGKKFNSEWIFRDLSLRIEENTAYAILGRNGSGKSTLLQVIAGNVHPSSGIITYTHEGKAIPDTSIFHFLSLVAPYQELIEEFTLPEMLTFHFSFKSMMPGFSIQAITDLLGFSQWRSKRISQYSSGMKQRVKLVCALFSNTPLLLLDEPTTNLDAAGIDWYLELMERYSGTRTIVVCSNLQQTETRFCSEMIHLEAFKPR